MASDFFLMCLLAVCISSLNIESFAHFELNSLLLLSCKNSLYILNIYILNPRIERFSPVPYESFLVVTLKIFDPFFKLIFIYNSSASFLCLWLYLVLPAPLVEETVVLPVIGVSTLV